MRKSILANLFIQFLFIQVNAQLLTIQDVEVNVYNTLKPKNLDLLQWKGNSNFLLYKNYDTIKEINITGGEVVNIITIGKLNQLFTNHNIDSMAHLPGFTVLNDSLLLFQLDSQLIYFSIPSLIILDVVNLPSRAENILLSKIPGNFSFTLGNNIWVRLNGEAPKPITFNIEPGISNGGIVYRSEFGFENGMIWSPNGNFLAYYKKDESKVAEFPITNINERIATIDYIKYPMAGMKSEETKVFIYSIYADTSLQLNINEQPEDYHTNICWTNDENYIYIQHLNRAQNFMSLKYYAVADGSCKGQLFSEKDDQYVEPQHPLSFIGLNGYNFIYQSRRDGYNHLYLYRHDKKVIEQLTSGNWEVTEMVSVSDDNNHIYFMANKENPLENHLYDLNIKTKKVVKLTTEPGTHYIIMNKNLEVAIDKFTSWSVPRQINIIHLEEPKTELILKAENPLINFTLGDVTFGTITAADDSSTLYYKLTKPIDFDSTKKYPVVVYVYGGPHVQLITNSWYDRYDLFDQYMAQHGYIGLTLDTRGSEKRGSIFEQVIHRQSGIPQLADELKGIDFLNSLNYVDTSRIGVNGWSYGGFMSVQMMLKYPDIYKVGVAGGPVIDWKFYEVMYGERYMDTPEENPEGYELTNLNNCAGNLKGKLLLIQGQQDPVVVWQNSLTFIESCIKANKQVDFFVYPSHEHNVRGADRVHLSTMVSEYFFKNL